MNFLGFDVLFVFMVLIRCGSCFDCITCNNKPEEDDTLPCVDRTETCSTGTKSCSTVLFRSTDDKVHTRKFCTSTGTPIYQYLMFFPGSALCQNIETSNAPSEPMAPMVVPGPNGTTLTVFPPAPPSEQASTLLCVCTKEKCNKGHYKEVMERNMMQNLKMNDDKKFFKKFDFLNEKFTNFEKTQSSP